MSREGWRKEVSRRPDLAVLKCKFVPYVVKRSQSRREAGIGREGERGRDRTVFILLKTHHSSLLDLSHSSHEKPADPFWSFYSATFPSPLPLHTLPATVTTLIFFFFPFQLRSPQPAHGYIVWCEKHPKMLLTTKILPWFRTSLHWLVWALSALSYIKKVLLKKIMFFFPNTKILIKAQCGLLFPIFFMANA